MTVRRLPARLKRPQPPASLRDALACTFAPAPDLLQWLKDAVIAEDGPLHNPEHAHIESADLAVLWAAVGYEKRGRRVLGETERVMFRSSGWQRERQEQQLREWFGRVPDWIITLDAAYCSACSDTDFAALVEHELYHIGHATDAFGAPRYSKQSGLPVLTLRGHDVEEFVGVVARYGSAGAVAGMVAAANKGPTVAARSIAAACGTCIQRAA